MNLFVSRDKKTVPRDKFIRFVGGFYDLIALFWQTLYQNNRSYLQNAI